MAAEFLQSLQELCPEVLSIVSDGVVRLLDSSPDEPFQDANIHEAFIDLAEAVNWTKFHINAAKARLRSVLEEPKKEGFKLDVNKHGKLIDALEQIRDRAQSILERKIATTEAKLGEIGLPRVIRLARKYKFTDAEERVLIYSIMTSVSKKSAQSSRYPGYLLNDPLNVCIACDISLSTLLEFLSSEREHMKHGLFSEVQHSYILHSVLTCEEIVVKAIIGCRLLNAEFLRLEQTCLADVVAEEPGGERYRSSQGPGVASRADGVPVDVDGVPDDGDVKANEKDADLDLDALLEIERLKEKELEKQMSVEAAAVADDAEETSGESLKPYKNDLEYLEHHIQCLSQRLKVKQMDSRLEMDAQYGNDIQDTRTVRQKREAESKLKVLEKECAGRLTLTKQAGAWMPRLERMASSRRLSSFEKSVLLTLIGSAIQPNKILVYMDGGMGLTGSSGFTVGELIRLFCSDLASQISRRTHFYKSAPMIREGMIIVHTSGLAGDPALAKVEIDRRMLDFCVGLDTEFSEIIEGSHLYFPKTNFDSVILSKDQKDLLLKTVSNFEGYKTCKKRMGLDDSITYGSGVVILFYGPPGTGKTMMANALANKIKKKVLLINFPSLGNMTADENFKFVFREAKINDAILFFDECEAIFETRDHGRYNINTLLTEFERHDGLIIMATNRPYDMDEAMHRRIMLTVEFRKPDHLLRKSIWETHIPEAMPLADDVNTDELALRYELTGGFIKNAVLSALAIAVSRDGGHPVVNQSDLLRGANLQLRGHLRMKDFDRRVVPVSGLDEVIVSDDLTKSLREIVSFEKARSIMFGQWGFGKRMSHGITALFHGPPGTGKSLAAEAIGYEVGRPLKVINCGELLSKWVGESTKNIDAIFEDGRNTDAILVFDDAEGLFGSRTSMTSASDRYANVDVSVLLYHVERYSGIVILTTNLIDNIDKAFFRRLKFILHFDTPSEALRAKMWKLLIPSQAPLADDINYKRLAEFEMAGGDIKSAIFKSASVAALRPEEERFITMDDLKDAAKDEISKTSGRPGFRRLDSLQGMYN